MSGGMYSETKKSLEYYLSQGLSFPKALEYALKRHNPVCELIGMEIIDIGDGYSKISFPYKKELANPTGSLHGGIIATAIDQAGSIAVWTSHKGEHQVTMELKINYLRPLMPEDSPFYAEGKVIKKGRTTVVALVTVYSNKGEPMAIGLGTWFKT